MTSIKRKSLHQLLYEFDRVFRATWELNSIGDVERWEFLASVRTNFTLVELLKMLLTPQSQETVNYLLIWYILTEEQELTDKANKKAALEGSPQRQIITISGPPWNRENVLKKVKHPMIQHKRRLLTMLKKHYDEKTST